MMKKIYFIAAFCVALMIPGSVVATPIVLTDFQKKVVDSLIERNVFNFLLGTWTLEIDIGAKFRWVDSIISDYDINEVAADIEYGNKRTIVRGKIDRIKKGIGGATYIILTSEDRRVKLQAHFSKNYISEIVKLRRGAIVSVLCSGSDMVNDVLVMKGCEPESSLRSLLLEKAYEDVALALKGTRKPFYAYLIALYSLAINQSMVDHDVCSIAGMRCAIDISETFEKMPKSDRMRAYGDAIAFMKNNK